MLIELDISRDFSVEQPEKADLPVVVFQRHEAFCSILVSYSAP